MRFPWLKLDHDENQPTAERRNRGTLTFRRGGTGVADVLRLQRKNAGDAYERVDLAVSSDLHDAVTVTDTASVDLTLSDQELSAAVLPAGVSHANLANLTTGDPHTQYLLEAGGTITGDLTINGHLIGPSTGPSIAEELAAGTGANAVITGNDNWGAIDLTTGTGPTTGEQFTVTFGTARPDTNYGVILFPREADAAGVAARVFAHAEAADHWDLTVITSALAASTLHQWTYLVVEY